MAFRFVIPLCALVAYASAGLIGSPLAIANPSLDAVAATQQNVVRSFAGTVSQYSKAVDTPYSSVRKTDTRINNNVYAPAIAKTQLAYAAAPVAAPLYTQATPVLPAPVLEKSVEITPAVTKTLYSAPAPAPLPAYAKSYVAAAPAISYAAPAPVAKAVSYAAPAYVAPAVAKTISYSAPAPLVAKSYVAPAAPVAYAAPAPVVSKALYAAPAVSYAAPAVAKSVSYGVPAGLASTNINLGPAASSYTHNAPGVSSYGSAQTVHYSPAEAVSHMSFDGFGTHWGF